MGIIVKNKENDQIMFYLKGAEVVMEKKVRPD
jgi:magnesium-transporting ATPase (P-type)